MGSYVRCLVRCLLRTRFCSASVCRHRPEGTYALPGVLVRWSLKSGLVVCCEIGGRLLVVFILWLRAEVRRLGAADA
jgi:hypothetical protein